METEKKVTFSSTALQKHLHWLKLTFAFYVSLLVQGGGHLETTNALLVAALGLEYGRLALLIEKASLINCSIWKY